MAENKNTLNWKTVGELERGAIGRALDSALADLTQDCISRPGLDKKRTVTLTITLSPVQDTMEDGKAKPPLIKTQAAIKRTVPGAVGNGEILQLTQTVNDDGEPVTLPSFPYNDLFPAGSN